MCRNVYFNQTSNKSSFIVSHWLIWLIAFLRLLLITFVFNIQYVSAQAINQGVVLPEIFGPGQGLPSAEVYDIHQDKDGYIWICTDRGISKYDGYKFENFNTSTPGISNNTVFKAFEIDDEIWFNCYDGSIFKVNKSTGKFAVVENNVNFTGMNWVEDIFSNEHYIYIMYSRYAQKVYQINKKTRVTTEISLQLQPNKPKINVKSIIIQDWQYSPEHVLIVDTISKTIKIQSKVYDQKRWYLYYDNLLLSFYNHTLEKKVVRDQLILGLKKINTKIFLYDLNGLNTVDSNIVCLPILQHISVSDIILDNDGNYWVSSLHSGLLKYTSFSKRVINLPILGNERILALATLDNFLVAGSSKGRYFTIKQKLSEPISPYSLSTKAPIKHIYKEKDGLYLNNTVIISLKNGRLNIKSTGNQDFYNSQHFASFNLLAENSTGYYIQKKNNLGLLNEKKIDVNLKIIHMYSVQDATYAATLNGIYKLEHNDLFKPIGIGGSVFEHLRVNKILGGHNFIIAATSGKGIFCIQNHKITAHLENLSSSLVNSIVFMNDSTLLVATNNGIDLVQLQFINGKTNFFLVDSYNTNNYLVSNYVYDVVFWNNAIWYSTDLGLASFQFDQNVNNGSAPKFILKSFIASGELQIGSNYNLKPTLNDIAIRYLAICTRKPSSNFYRYKIVEGNDDVLWTFTDAQELVFNNLDPGNYKVYLSARNYKDVWSEAKVISFTIQPAFIQRPLIQFIIISLCFGVIYVFYTTRLKRVQQKQKKQLELTEMEGRYTEAALSALKSQINPHFIFNALQSIQGFVIRNQTSKANEYLSKFSKLIRTGLQHSTLEFISISEEIEFLKTYMEIERVRFPDRFKFQFQVEKNLLGDDIKMPPLMLQPICENAIKHAFNQEHINNLIEVELTLHADENALICVIRDNGIGMFADKPISVKYHESKGIDLIQKRIDMLTQKYGIGSIVFGKVKTGTIVTIILPIE